MDQRKAERKASLNFLDFEQVARGGEVLNQGLGRTLNVSEKGVLLETHAPLEPGSLLRVAVGLGEDVVTLTGTVVHSEVLDDDHFQAGIEFLQLDAQGKRVFDAYFRAFKAQA